MIQVELHFNGKVYRRQFETAREQVRVPTYGPNGYALITFYRSHTIDGVTVYTENGAH